MLKTLKALQNRIDKLEAAGASQVTGRNGQAAVTLGNNVFRDIEDGKAFINLKVGSNLDDFNFGVFTDPLAILNRINSSLTNDYSDLKEVSVRSSMKMSVGEQNLMQAMQIAMPKIFMGSTAKDKIFTGFSGKGKAAKNTQGRFANCKTFKDWEDDQRKDGIKFRIIDHLPHIREELYSDIDLALLHKPEAKVLALQLMTISIAFIEHLCEFISDAFREVNRGLDATDSQSWDLVCFVVQQVFQSSFEKARRSVGSGAADPKNRLTFGAHLLLASIRMVHAARLLQSKK